MLLVLKPAYCDFRVVNANHKFADILCENSKLTLVPKNNFYVQSGFILSVLWLHIFIESSAAESIIRKED
jgi:hypothetical protein